MSSLESRRTAKFSAYIHDQGSTYQKCRYLLEKEENAPTEWPEPTVEGVKLSALTQALAYRVIRSYAIETQSPRQREASKRQRTMRNIAKIQETYARTYGKYPQKSSIWMNSRTKDVDKPTQEFIWKLTHDVQMVGDKWARHANPEFHSRGFCTHCDNEIEDMDHILFRCRAIGQKLIWKLTEQLWRKRCQFWREPSLATVVAPGLIENPNDGAKVKRCDRRLFVVT